MFALSRKLSGYEFPAISKQRDVIPHAKKNDTAKRNTYLK